jgi:hypothetical protein
MVEWSAQFQAMATPYELPSINTIQNNFYIKRLKRRLLQLEKIHFDDQTIVIEGCEHLRSVPGQHWRSKIYSLFHDAGLPRFYILDMSTDDITDNIPQKITIQLITYRVKLFVRSVLLEFFLSQNMQNISVSFKS